MASAWGNSWGSSWGNSWGAITAGAYVVKGYVNGAWVAGTLKYWNGSAWLPVPLIKYWSGGTWV